MASVACILALYATVIDELFCVGVTSQRRRLFFQRAVIGVIGDFQRLGKVLPGYHVRALRVLSRRTLLAIPES